MIYNKTERRVRTYIPVLKGRMFSPISEVGCWSEQLTAYSDNAVSKKAPVTSYPFGFGKEGEDTRFSFSLDIPSIREDVFLSFPLETDSLVEVDGTAYCNCNPAHPDVNMSRFKGKHIEVTVTCWNAYEYPGWGPVGDRQLLTVIGKHQRSYPIILNRPCLTKKNTNCYDLYYDLVALTENYDTVPENSLLRQRGYSILHDALIKLRISSHDEKEWEEDAEKVRAVTKELLSQKNGTLAPSIPSVGMSHLDHAWLWPIRETHRKAVRTLAGSLTLMEEYPELRYLFTQPEQIQRAFELKPELKERVMDAFSRGQFEPNGVGLIEADGMLSTGEGLIRNLLYGRKLTEKLFPGYRGDTYILPDSFGYNGNLPQILKGCGVEYFVTSKIGWNDTTRFPYDIFSWRGIDGTEIKTSMIQGGYEGTNSPVQIKAMWDKVQHKDVQDRLFRTIGEGDGGGGVRRDDLELIRRLGDTEGCPKTYWTTTSEALKSVFASARNLPVYDGELYFELHRGTYTTQTEMKKGYRRVSTLLHNVDYLLALCWAEGRIDEDELNSYLIELGEFWNRTVIYQFHDILPGSCVGCVYEETNAFYAEAEKRLEDIEKRLAGDGRSFMNLTPCPQYGIAPYSTGNPEAADFTVSDGRRVETGWGTVGFDEDGTISSVVYKGRELVKGGKWNTLLFGEDVPLWWDAWDVEKDTIDNLEELPLPFVSNVRSGRIGEKSTIKQTSVVYRNEGRIDFVTEIDWHEEHKILRSEFPVDIRAKEAVYDIPFGYIKRPTTWNNQTERAQFESPALSYVSVSDTETIIALMSDSKYGFSAKDGVLSISLLRAPKAPDGNADMGRHVFTYSIYFGGENLHDVMAKAELINNPLVRSSRHIPLISVTPGHFSLETVKIAEDGESICFRVVENMGIPGNAEMSFSKCLDTSTLMETNMLEEPEEHTSFDFHAFEVKTYLIRRMADR